MLYEQTDKSKLTDLENIEKTVRTSIVGAGQSRNRPFFIEQTTGITSGKTRQIKSCVGVLKLKAKLGERLGRSVGGGILPRQTSLLKSRSQLSPLLEKCCLRLSANESYQNAEAEIEALTGMIVGHSTQQRLVNRQELPLPSTKQGISEISVDGGKVRLRGEPKAGSHWKDYKAVRKHAHILWCIFC